MAIGRRMRGRTCCAQSTWRSCMPLHHIQGALFVVFKQTHDSRFLHRDTYFETLRGQENIIANLMAAILS